MPVDLAEFARAGAELRTRFFGEQGPAIRRAADAIVSALETGGKVLAFGNGGSAADAQHLAGELVGRYHRERRALAAIALSTDTSVLTCIANDYDYDAVFARQIEALGRPGDVCWAISTSGNSPNVLRGIEAAKGAGLFVIGLTGNGGGTMAALCDLPLVVPSEKTALIQETHLAILHAVCELIDERFAE